MSVENQALRAEITRLRQQLAAQSMLMGEEFVERLHIALDAKGAPRKDGGNTLGLIGRIDALATPAPVAAGEGMVTVPRGALQALLDAQIGGIEGDLCVVDLVVADPLADALTAAPAQSPVSAEVERLRSALQSIANSACCGSCQEAKLVARAALTNGGDNA